MLRSIYISMTGLFFLVLLLSIPAFFWSLFKPQTFQPLFKDKIAETNIGRFFCYLIIFSFFGFLISSPVKDNNTSVAKPPVTSQNLEQKSVTQPSSQVQTQQVQVEQPAQVKQPEVQPQQKIQSDSQTAKVEESKPSTSTSIKPAYTSPTYNSSSSCGEDYYKNSNGICVHSPSNNPSGATAECRDGSYSYSLHRRGTCSGHGGVEVWY